MSVDQKGCVCVPYPIRPGFSPTHDHEISFPSRSCPQYTHAFSTLFVYSPFFFFFFYVCLHFFFFFFSSWTKHVSFTISVHLFSMWCGRNEMLLYPNIQYLEGDLSYGGNVLNRCQLHDLWRTKMACRRRNAGIASDDGVCLYKGYQFNNKDGSCSCIVSVSLLESAFISSALYSNDCFKTASH